MSQPIFCVSGCGFYGNPLTDNMCSKCFNLKKKERESNTTATTSAAMNIPTMVVEKASPNSVSNTIPIAARPSSTLTSSMRSQAQSVGADTGRDRMDITGTSADAASSLPGSLNAGSYGSSPGNSSAPRCATCSKRLGLTAIKCRCEQYFCPLHRSTNSHNCSFDYKAFGRDQIAKNNPTVVASKLDKI